MLRRIYRIIVTSVAFILVIVGGKTATMATTMIAPSRPAPALMSRHVTLITGDVVNLSTSSDGRLQAAVLPRNSSRPGRQFQTFNLGKDLYVVPLSAVPYLGSTLAPALFDVSKLATTPVSTIPIMLRSNAGPVRIPGLRITQRIGTTARAVPEPGTTFGAALGRQWYADHDSGTHTSGLFASVARIGATSTPPSSAGTHTVTINGIDPTGNKGTGEAVFVVNVDDINTYNAVSVLTHGTTTADVPDGHYLALTFFADPTTGAVHVVEVPQFTVTGDTAITLDGRDATSRVSVATPRPATAVVSDLTVGRTDANGATAPITLEGEAGVTFFVEPTTKRVSVGALHYAFYTRLLSPTAAATPYSYDLKFFHDDTIPAHQHYVVHNSTVATVDSKYAASHINQAALTTQFSALPWDSTEFGVASPLTVPTNRIEYFTASPAVVWQSDYTSVFLSGTALGDYFSAARTYTPGEKLFTEWGMPPGHPVLDSSPIGLDGQVVCPACLSGNQIGLVALPFSDNAHAGAADPGGIDGLTESLQYRVFADAKQVDSGDFLETDATVPGNTKRLSIAFYTVRSSPDFLLSTAVLTRWTIPTAAPTTALPTNWRCSDFPDFPRTCRILPLTTADYQLPVNLLGELQPGRHAATLRLGHLGDPTNMPFRSAEVTVSYDNGKSWLPVRIVHRRNNTYGIALNVPSTDGFGALQISTRDQIGGTFSQTIQHAFRIGTK